MTGKKSSKRAELKTELISLQDRGGLLDAAEHLAQIGHYEWNFELDRLVSCSREYARIFKLSVEDALAAQNSTAKILDFIHPEDRDRFSTASDRLKQEGSLDIKYRIVRNDGELRHIRELSVLIVDEAGNKTGNIGIVQDITDQVGYEQELEYRDELSQQAEAITDIGHFIFDLQTESYDYISPGFARIHGVSVDEYLERVESREDDIGDVHQEDYARLLEVYNEHSHSGDDFSVEYRIRRPDGEVRWIREQSTSLSTSSGEIRQSIGVVQDITERKQTEQYLREARDSLEAMVSERTRELAETIRRLEEEIEEREKVSAELNFLANHDALTGLPSLRLCKDRLDRSLVDARRNQQNSAVMFLDLDGFKDINDSYGHELGDLVLKVTADRIKAEIRETDTVARIGGDEFVIILSRVPELSVVERIASSLVRQILQPIHIVQFEVSVSASIGISLYPEHGSMSEELIRSADKAMYQVKNQGKNNFQFFKPD